MEVCMPSSETAQEEGPPLPGWGRGHQEKGPSKLAWKDAWEFGADPPLPSVWEALGGPGA